MIEYTAEQLRDMPHKQTEAIIKRWKPAKRVYHYQNWHFWRRSSQCPPSSDWRIWLVKAGRGFGKTRMGAEWVNEMANNNPNSHIAIIGATLTEARQVMVEGQSGIMSLTGADALRWIPTLRRIIWPNGSTATLYSAAEPESLRGPQHHFAWADEIAKWGYGIDTWDNLMLGMRLGDKPQIVATTTPRPVRLLGRLLGEAGVAVTGGSTGDNAFNLAPDFMSDMQALYGGTRIGRQELDGELIEDAEGALWTRNMIETCRIPDAPILCRVVIGVDPPITSGGDACGIVAVGLGDDGRAYVLADCSVKGKSPEGWARAVAIAADHWHADRIVAEGNQGGEMVESTLRAASLSMPIKRVHARTGKSARAEPIAALFEAHRASFAGCFPELEDELCGMVTGGGYEGPGRSPDRADAMVWAMHELMLRQRKGRVGVRVV
jgi:phage terminase large subunit-like protein